MKLKGFPGHWPRRDPRRAERPRGAQRDRAAQTQLEDEGDLLAVAELEVGVERAEERARGELDADLCGNQNVQRGQMRTDIW